MRNQLQKFTEFADRLLPHETEYLLSVQQFADEERLAILRRVDYNCHHIGQFTPYDTAIDKRKYNHLTNWIDGRLRAIDVDEQFEWMSRMERKIMTDAIQAGDEKELLRAIRQYQHPTFFFTKFYELVELYRHFLLIRIRYDDHRLTDDFVQQYREAYLYSKAINEKLHTATRDIVGQYSDASAESRQWEDWLTEIFYQEDVDGLNRYLALVRLTFISFNYQQFDLLLDKFDYVDRMFSEGRYYSKRILLNYYSNRLMLHSRFGEYDRAIYYGYLSVRAKTHDYLHYVNNLCAVLLRRGRNEEALSLMKTAAPEVKFTKNFHTRVGFVAFYAEALNKNGLYKNAESYCDSFLKAYAKEVLQYRWHLFFSVYFEALLHRRQYTKLLQTTRKYQLLDKDKQYRAKAQYLPTVPIYHETARYLEGLSGRDELQRLLQSYRDAYQEDPDRLARFQQLLASLRPLAPDVIR